VGRSAAAGDGAFGADLGRAGSGDHRCCVGCRSTTTAEGAAHELQAEQPGYGAQVLVGIASPPPMGGHRVVAVTILLVALGVGALGAVAVHRRLGQLLDERLDQPYRVLRPVTASGKAGVLFSAMVMAGMTWLEVSGQIVIGLSVVLGTVALLLLPGAFVALLVSRRADAHDLAGREVWWIATRGRVPRIDQPACGLRPLPGPAPEGVLAQLPGPTDPTHPATPRLCGLGCAVRKLTTVQEHLPPATGNHDRAHRSRALCPWKDRSLTYRLTVTGATVVAARPDRSQQTASRE
jgi:hypothetical protein